MCRFWFDSCINATGSNLAAQFECTRARDEQCGNLTVGRVAAASSSALRSITLNSLASTAQGSPAPNSVASQSASEQTSAAITSSSSSSTPKAGTVSKTSISGGTIAGAVIGGLGGLAIVVALVWFCMRRRRKRAEALAATSPGIVHEEKQVTDPTAMPLPRKAELHGETTIDDGHLPQVVDGTTQPIQYSQYPPMAELPSMPRQTPPELYAPYHRSNELQGSGFHRAAEIQAPVPQSELEASAPPYTQAHASTHPYQPPHEAQELYAMSSEPSRSVMQRQLSSDEISALGEEERRIDAEMSEVRRMKELRDQKLAIQQKLKEAKGV
jgi:hypothetical protein